MSEIVPVTSEAELREIVGQASAAVRRKDVGRLDEHARTFLAASPFLLLATASADGTVDVSPRGEPLGKVVVLDEHTLAIPDRPGNRRVDSLSNILANPQVGLLFVIPGKQETLRVNGRAQIVRQAPYFADMAVEGKAPRLAIHVEVRECFFHCSKAFRRSALWEPATWPELTSQASLGQVLHDQLALRHTAEQVDADLEIDARENLY